MKKKSNVRKDFGISMQEKIFTSLKVKWQGLGLEKKNKTKTIEWGFCPQWGGRYHYQSYSIFIIG